MICTSLLDPPEISEMLWHGCCKTGLGFDVGANCGQSIYQILRFAERVVAFEPHPGSYAHMDYVWCDEPQVTLCNIAVSSMTGEVELAQLPGEQAQTGQLVTPGTDGMEWQPEDWQPEDWSAVPVVTCRCRDLDTLVWELGVPGFITVDTEGHEAQVLIGGRRLIHDHLPEWLIEFHSPGGREMCLAILETMGCGAYRIETVRHPRYPVGSAMWYQHGWIKAFAR